MPRMRSNAIGMALFALLSVVGVQAQLLPSNHGWIEGKVSDPQGAAIPRTIVTAINESTKKEVTMTTDQAGSYRFLGLIPGSYRLRFAAQGFATATRDHVLASSAKITQLDVRLQVGQGGGVEVTGVPPANVEICRGGPDVPAANDPMPDETESAVSIQGRVTDSTGMAVPARITAFEYSTEKLYTSTTDSEGVYRLRGLPEGNYCLAYQAGEWGAGRAGNDVKFSPPEVVARDIRLPVLPERVEVCSDSCPVETLPEPSSAGITLHLYAEHNVVVRRDSPLWVTVTLTNTTKHTIVIQSKKEPDPVFTYEIHAYGLCCPKSQKSGWQNSPSLPVRLRPGGTLTERVDLCRLLGWNAFSPYGSTLQVWVSLADTSKAKNGEKAGGLHEVISNQIKVALTSQ